MNKPTKPTPATKKSKMAGLGEAGYTPGGFEYIEFTDAYGENCSLQVSGLADYTKCSKPGTYAVWLGIDSVKPDRIGSRMHLRRMQVEALVAHLQRWLDKGTFKL